MLSYDRQYASSMAWLPTELPNCLSARSLTPHLARVLIILSLHPAISLVFLSSSLLALASFLPYQGLRELYSVHISLPFDVWPLAVSCKWPANKKVLICLVKAGLSGILFAKLTYTVHTAGLPSASLQSSTAAVLTFREQRGSWLQVASVNAERKCLFDLAGNVLFLLDPYACFLLSLRLRSFGKFWSLCIALLQATCDVSGGASPSLETENLSF